MIGSAIFTIGGALFSTMGFNSGAGHYIGYQLLLGVGQGICIQIPVITAQAFSAPEDVPTATSAVLCKSSLGSTDAAQSPWLIRRSLPDDGWCCVRSCWSMRLQ